MPHKSSGCGWVGTVCILMVLSACGMKPEASTPAKTPIQVEILEVQPETMQETMVASGVAAAKVEHRVSAEVEGMLKTQHVDQGDKVSKGMVLFKLESEEFELQAKERIANLDRAQAYFGFMVHEFERGEPLYQDKTLSQAQWDKLEYDLASARADRDQARVALAQAKRKLRLTTIRSPITGIVLERYHEAGEVVPRGSVLARIVEISRIIYEIGLSDRELAHVTLGNRVNVRVDAFPEKIFNGEITRISGNANPGTGSFPIEVTVENSNHKILPGMVGRVEISGKIHHDRIIVPLMSVQQQLEGTVVYTVENNRVSKKWVRLGKVLGDRVLILEGIEPGDRIVLVGQGRLKSGDPVEIIQSESSN